MEVLVVGGAGYIGSHMVKLLRTHGIGVTVVDNLSSGFRKAVDGAELIELDLADQLGLEELLRQRSFDAVMHFASYIQVGESVKEPAKYYENNVTNTQHLLNAMLSAGVSHLIFSSTAAIFGEPIRIPIDEQHPKAPNNPYGRSKWMVEQMLADYDRAYGLKSVCLRYFNAAGADPDCELGERHDPETHLIPLVLQAASGRRDSISVLGTNYHTPDGTCIRDYVHVNDLCDAHLLALRYLYENDQSAQFNLGNGSGYSVREVIDTAKEVTAREFTVREEARRQGDPARLVADSHLIRKELGWVPQYPELRDIIGHAWQWELKMAKGMN